jgi:hypothetical protein
MMILAMMLAFTTPNVYVCEGVSVHMNLLRRKNKNVRVGICDDFFMLMKVFKSQKKRNYKR